MYNPGMAFPKTYRTNAGWALSIGTIVALFSNLRNEQRAVISLAILGALGFLWSAREHEWIRLNRKSIPRVLAILGLFFLIAWFVWPPPPPLSQTAKSLTPLLKAQIYAGNILSVFEPNHECKGYILYLSPEMDDNGTIDSFASVNLSVQFPEIVKDHRVDLFLGGNSGGLLSAVVYKEKVGCRFAQPPNTLPASAVSNWNVTSNAFTFKASPFDMSLQAAFLTDESGPAPVGMIVSTPIELQKRGEYQYGTNDPLRALEFDYPAKREVWTYHAPVPTKK
jgi:hypothetical protein